MTLFTWILEADITNMAGGILSDDLWSPCETPSVMDGHEMFLRGFLSPYHGIYHVSKNASLLPWATPEQ